MFTQKCIVDMSHPWMWRKLAGWGLKLNPLNGRMLTGKQGDGVYLLCDRGVYSTLNCNVEEEDVHDCEGNLALFFALAAMRDDSDQNQWFIYDDRYEERENPQRFWFRCHTEKVRDEYPRRSQYCDKADVKQIIRHFTEGDDDDSYL